MTKHLAFLVLAVTIVAVVLAYSSKSGPTLGEGHLPEHTPVHAVETATETPSTILVPTEELRGLSGFSILGLQVGMKASELTTRYPDRFHVNGRRLEAMGVALDLDERGEVVAVNGSAGSTVEVNGERLFAFSDGYEKARTSLQEQSALRFIENTAFSVEVLLGGEVLRVIALRDTSPNGNKGYIAFIRLTSK